MRLSPLDIQHIDFERSVSGYRPAQVRAFLERIAAEREELLKELQALRDRVQDQDKRIEGLEAAEADLRHAVVAAERIANQMRENAREEARLIVREAETERRQHLTEMARLRELRERFREQFRALLRSYEHSLDADLAAADEGAVGSAGEGGDVDGDDAALSERDLHDTDPAR